MSQTKKRKGEHLDIARDKDVNFRKKTTGLEDVELIYQTLPELSKDEIDLSTEFLGKRFSAPLTVSGITGGIDRAEKINKDIAKACEELGLGMGVGSQRAMIETPDLASTYFVRDVAPNIFLAGNIGAAQIKEHSADKIKKALEDIGADALAIHMNIAQEAMQKEGDFDFRNCIEAISKISNELDKPVYVKEVGHGVSHEIAKQLNNTGIKAIDVQGAGGTTWTGVDSLRGHKDLGEVYWDFGIPTAVSVIECRKGFSGPVIASGGIRDGLDIVKSIVLGANMTGIARPVFLAQQENGSDGVKDYLEKIIDQIRTGMLLVGAKNIEELKKKSCILHGKTREWIEQRKLD